MHYFSSEAELCAFRARAMAAVSVKGALVDAVRAWRDLTDGHSSIVDSFTTAEYSYLVTTNAVRHAPIPQRGLRALERVLTGSCPKEVAADCNVSLPTISGVLKEALCCIGSKCLPSKVPLGLVALIYAARAAGPHPMIWHGSVQVSGIDLDIQMTPLPSLSHLFPPAVHDVVRLHAAGKSHREIAGLRGRSTRTVANQLATAFQRVGSSGRYGMLEFLLSRGQEAQWGKTG